MVESMDKKTPLEKVLASIPKTNMLYVRDLRGNHVRGIGFGMDNKIPINYLEFLYITKAVASGELKPDDFEIWNYEDGVYHFQPDGTCDKKWDFAVAVENISKEITK